MGNVCTYPKFKSGAVGQNKVEEGKQNKIQIPSIIVTQTNDRGKRPSIIKTMCLDNLRPISFSGEISEPSTPGSNSLEFCSPVLEDLPRAKWIQICGHEDSFVSPEDDSLGVIMKRYSSIEADAYMEIGKENKLSRFVPKFFEVFTDSNENKFLKIQDLLTGYETPEIMDCKIGCITYLEEELGMMGSSYRNDLYEKMVKIDPDEPTAEEHDRKAILKSRYMLFRESLSSSATLGFRVDGIKKWNKTKKFFQTSRTYNQVRNIFLEFTQNETTLINGYLRKIESLRQTLVNSEFFPSHQIVGSSLLFIHNSDLDPEKTTLKMIDFARVQPSRNGRLLHSVFNGGHDQEEGYLIGIDNIIAILKSLG